MITLPSSALWRAANACAKLTRILSNKVALARLLPRHRGKHVKNLNDHLARDAGLSPADMARHRHVWPSQFSGWHSI